MVNGAYSLPFVNAHNVAVTPECYTFQQFSHTTIDSKSNNVHVPPSDAEKLFSDASSKDLGQLLNPQLPRNLEKERLNYYHRLKYIY